MSAETWRKYWRHIGTVALALLAWQGVLYYVGSEPIPLSDFAIVLSGMALVAWIILRVNPGYYDRKRLKVPESVD